MNTPQPTPPREESTFSWMFNLLTLIILTSFVTRRFFPDYWSAAALAVLVMIFVGACAMLACWALGKPVSRSAALLMGLMVCAATAGAAKGIVDSEESRAAPAPIVERHGTIAESTFLGPEKLHLD